MPLKPEVSEGLESIKSPLSKFTAIVGLLALASVLIWMNRFQYEHTGTTQVLVRINRFSGQQCFLTSERGWDSQLLRAGKDDPFSKYGGQEIPSKDAELLFDKNDAANNLCR